MEAGALGKLLSRMRKAINVSAGPRARLKNDVMNEGGHVSNT